MEEIKYVKKLIEQKDAHGIDKLRDVNQKKLYASFEGIPKKHPTDSKVLILFTDPFSKDRTFYEFSIDSIANIEELGTISSPEGESAYKIRVWAKKGMPALKSTPLAKYKNRFHSF